MWSPYSVTLDWKREGIQFKDEDQKKGSMLYFAPNICNTGPDMLSMKMAWTLAESTWGCCQLQSMVCSTLRPLRETKAKMARLSQQSRKLNSKGRDIWY